MYVRMFRRKLTPSEIALLPPQTQDVFTRFQKAGKAIYLVGGGVRNILAGNIPINCDFTTNARPEEILQILADLKPYYDNPYGTVAFTFVQESGQKQVYEITPYRTEQGYTDRRRPDQVAWGDSLVEDLKRRDFTINAIVIGLPADSPLKGEMELLDDHEGLADLDQKLIRTVGNPDERFKEDALRLMRAIRLAAQLSFQIDPQTLKAIRENAGLLADISRERVRDELMKILGSHFPADGVQLLVATGLMSYIIPELLEARGVAQTGHHTMDVFDHLIESLRQCPSPDPLVRLATLLHDVGKPRTRRLKCKKCGFMLKDKDKIESGQTAKETRYQCPRCGNIQSEHESATFHGHEVIGARMTDEIAQRLRFSNKEREKLVTLVRWHMFAYDSQMTDAAIRRFIRRVGKENINDMILLRIGDRKGGRSKTTSWRLMEFQKRIGQQLYEPMTVSDLAIDGHDLMKELDLKPGPVIGRILKVLFEEVIEDTNKNTREYLLSQAKELQNS